MEEVKITIEKIGGYKADDGTFFVDKEQCVLYEETAFFAAKMAAKSLIVNSSDADDAFGFCYCGDDPIVVYDIPDAESLKALNMYLRLSNKDNSMIPVDYIGKIIAFHSWAYDSEGLLFLLGTKEEILQRFASKLDALFQGNPGEEAKA